MNLKLEDLLSELDKEDRMKIPLPSDDRYTGEVKVTNLLAEILLRLNKLEKGV